MVDLSRDLEDGGAYAFRRALEVLTLARVAESFEEAAELSTWPRPRRPWTESR